MKQAFCLFIIAGLLAIASCSEDKCAGKVCQNEGTCRDGKCLCSTDFTGENCETYTNGCDTTRCYFGGYCVADTCNCPPHTSGDSCFILEAPSLMYITSVTVNKFHPSNINGITWDADDDDSQADIYPVIKKDGIVVYHGHNQNQAYAFKPNANYDTQYPLRFQEDSIAISGADVTNSNWRVELWDYDNGADDDFMEGRNFKPFTGIDGFPGSILLQDTTYYHDKFEFRVNFTPYYRW